MTQGVAELLAKLEGWGGLDLENPAFEQLRNLEESEALAHANAFALTFNAPGGEYVLKWLIRNYVMPSILTGESTQFRAGIRQGEANVVAGILATIEYAKHGGRT